MFGPAYAPWRRQANTGGPSSRSRSERIQSTLLGLKDGPILCPLNLCLALEFAGQDPVASVRLLLARVGWPDPESLRGPFGQGLWPMVCRPNPRIAPLQVRTDDPVEVLRTAFLLGLCTSVRFDPGRPVLWTRASLTRRLELFDLKEFYA